MVSQDYDLTHKFIQDSRYSIGKINKYLYNLRYSRTQYQKRYSNDQHKNSVIIIFKYNFIFFKKKFESMKTTDQMFLYLQNKNKNVIQNSIYYSYMIDTKIPFRIISNPIFIVLIIIRYLFLILLL